jgi:translocation and assembly module TamA
MPTGRSRRRSSVTVRERAAHRVSFGAGVSSNTGARVEFNYHTPDLFNQAWVLDSGLRLEQKKQTAYSRRFPAAGR